MVKKASVAKDGGHWESDTDSYEMAEEMTVQYIFYVNLLLFFLVATKILYI